MPIDVLYEGMVLARGTRMVATEAGTLVELEAPMPVGCQLVLDDSGTACPVRVVRVHEGVGSGVFVVALAGALPGHEVVPAPRPGPPPQAAPQPSPSPSPEASPPAVAVAVAVAAPAVVEAAVPVAVDCDPVTARVTERSIDITAEPESEEPAMAAAAGGVVTEEISPEASGEVTEPSDPNDANGKKTKRRGGRARKGTKV